MVSGGGLNLYGYANGDPVNYSDPFGLCPEEDRDADGKCPGGLSVEQWEEVEAVARRMLQMSEASTDKAEYGAYVLGAPSGAAASYPRVFGGGSNDRLVGSEYYGGDLPAATPAGAVALVHSHPYGLTVSGRGRIAHPLRLSGADAQNAVVREIPVFAVGPQGLRVVLPSGVSPDKIWPL